MEYVLMDIKNFLKKLENGQMEIEAGQWELHKAMISVSKTVSELLNLKQDVADMKRSNLHQMGLIRDLQVKLDKINNTPEQEQPVTVSESSVEYEGVFKRPCDGQGFKKRKCRIRSEEIIEITSQMSEDKSESELDESVTQQQPEGGQTTEFKDNDNGKNSDEESGGCPYKRESYILPAQNKADCDYTAHTSTDILQRYLKDSERYLEKKLSDATEVSFHSNEPKAKDMAYSDAEYRPFWDEYSSRAPPETNEENDSAHSKEETAVDDKPEKSFKKKFLCPNCPKKFLSKIDLLMHKRTAHQSGNAVLRCNTCGKAFGNKLRLKDHKMTHKLSKSFKGFKCSYCSKVCASPEKLTEHLRKCRTIMKPQFKEK